jgi:nitrogen regulatory protein P-II 1
MKLLIFVLNKTDKLDDVLSEFARRNMCGATVLDSMGMAHMLAGKHDEDELPFLGAFRRFLNPDRQQNNVILAAIDDSQVEEAVAAIESIVGDLSNEDTGVVFCVPIDYTKGICKIGK